MRRSSPASPGQGAHQKADRCRITLCHHATAQQNRFQAADRSRQGLEEHPYRRSPSLQQRRRWKAHRCHQGRFDRADSVGPEAKIRAWPKADLDISSYRLVDALHSHDAPAKAVALCRSGEGRRLMKGSLHTDELMGAVVLRHGAAHRTADQPRFRHGCATYPRPLFITDRPSTSTRPWKTRSIFLKNAIQLAQALNISHPRWPFSHGGNMNPKMPATIEAAALLQNADRDRSKVRLSTGPLARQFPSAKKPPRSKGHPFAGAGEADILSGPTSESR